MTKDTDDNIIRIVSSKEDPRATTAEPTIPQFQYRLNYQNGEYSQAHGFLVFTSQHVAVMRDDGTGAIPILVAPLENVVYASIVEEPEQEPLPF